MSVLSKAGLSAALSLVTSTWLRSSLLASRQDLQQGRERQQASYGWRECRGLGSQSQVCRNFGSMLLLLAWMMLMMTAIARSTMRGMPTIPKTNGPPGERNEGGGVMILPRANNMQLLQIPSPAKHLLSYEITECIDISSFVNSEGPLFTFLGIFCNWLFRMWLCSQLQHC